MKQQRALDSLMVAAEATAIHYQVLSDAEYWLRQWNDGLRADFTDSLAFCERRTTGERRQGTPTKFPVMENARSQRLANFVRLLQRQPILGTEGRQRLGVLAKHLTTRTESPANAVP